MSEPTRMSRERWEAARAFLESQSRPLERSLFRWRHEGGDPEAVLEALAAFANPDGGFGNGIEPDLRSPSSSPFSTSVAFQHLRALGTPGEHPMVGQALDYLQDTWDAETASWPVTPEDTAAHPHAPWWEGKSTPDPENLNPRAELLGVLTEHRDRVPVELRAETHAAVWERLDAAGDALEMHEIQCVLRLAETPGLDPDERGRLRRQLLAACKKAVGTTPEDWAGYGLRPLDVAPTPGGLLYPEHEDAVRAQLDHLLETQEEDGTWSPSWSWADRYPAAWEEAEREWRGVLLVKHLESLAAHDRLP